MVLKWKVISALLTIIAMVYASVRSAGVFNVNHCAGEGRSGVRNGTEEDGEGM